VVWSRLALVAALALAGCSIHPLPEDVTGKSTFAIAQSIRCEAQQALLEYAANSKYDTGAIAYDFSFTITEDNVANVAPTFKDPFSALNSLTLGTTGASNPLFNTGGTNGTGGALQRLSIRKFVLVDGFGELKRVDCGGAVARARPLYPITGSIGLREVVRSFMLLEGTGALQSDPTVPASAFVKSASSTVDFSDELKFTTTLTTGNLVPNLVLAPLTGQFRLVGLTGAFGADRQDIHHVVVALTLPANLSKTAGIALAARRGPGSVGGAITGAVPSNVVIASEPNAKAKALQILDRRKVLGQTDALIQAINSLRQNQ
jgi:hypothetical protein